MRALAALLLLAAACKGREETGEQEATAAAPAATRDAAPEREKRTVKPDDEPPGPERRQAEELLTAWLVAQSSADFAAYQKLYADRFTGVRRSGAKVRRFDRAGWMADRARMFEKSMAVTADAIVVKAHKAKIHLFFTQTFEQGSYKDTGRKWMALGRAAGGLRIEREEMLDSTLLARQDKELSGKTAAPPALAAGQVELGWAGKRDRLYLAPVDDSGHLLIGRASGSIGTGPVEVVDQTTDAASGALGGVSARRAVDLKSLPPALASRLGKTVQLLDDDFGPLCHARVSGYSLEVTDWAPQTATDDAPVAAAALLDDAPVVVAELQLSGCPKGAAWGRDVDLPPLREPPDLDAAEEKRMRQALDGKVDEESPEISFTRVAGDPSRAVAAAIAHTEDTCETQEEYRMVLFLLTRKGKAWKAARLAEYTYEDELAGAVDADGDGAVDVFTRLGAHRAGTSDFWRHDVRVFWPPGLGCDGCEGDDC